MNSTCYFTSRGIEPRDTFQYQTTPVLVLGCTQNIHYYYDLLLPTHIITKTDELSK